MGWKSHSYRYAKWKPGKCPDRFNFVNSVDRPAEHIVHRVMGVSTPPSCEAPNEELWYIDRKANECGQVCVTTSQASLIKEVLKANAGSCVANTHYTVYNTTTTVTVPVVGSLNIATYYEASRTNATSDMDREKCLKAMAAACPGLKGDGDKCRACIQHHSPELRSICAHTGSGQVFCEQHTEVGDGPHFPTYCNYKGYCHCPPLPLTCTSDLDCQTPWYNSTCSVRVNATTSKCKDELPP